jgi:hypothetical protein
MDEIERSGLDKTGCYEQFFSPFPLIFFSLSQMEKISFLTGA